MEILKILIVFAIIIVVMAAKKPLMIAVTAATVGTILIYRLPLDVTLQAALQVLIQNFHRLMAQ